MFGYVWRNRSWFPETVPQGCTSVDQRRVWLGKALSNDVHIIAIPGA